MRTTFSLKGPSGIRPTTSIEIWPTVQTPHPCHRVFTKPRCHARYRRAPVAPGFRLVPEPSPSDRCGRAGELATASPAPYGLDDAGQPRRRRPLSRSYSTNQLTKEPAPARAVNAAMRRVGAGSRSYPHHLQQTRRYTKKVTLSQDQVQPRSDAYGVQVGEQGK
jgi:hypothetical protein